MELQLSRSEVQEVAVDLGTLAAIQKNTGFIPREKKRLLTTIWMPVS